MSTQTEQAPHHEQPTAQDQEIMGKVIAEAQRAIEMDKAGVAAALVFRDQILALGHNMSQENGDMTAHAEMVVLRAAAHQLAQLSDEERAEVTVYSTLEPCLMCTAAISFAGLKRVVYSALTEDFDQDQMIAEGLTIETINDRLTRGPLTLVPGVLHEEGKRLLVKMDKQA